MLRQEVEDLQKAYNKEREDKLEIIRQCLNQLSGIDTDITSLEGQIFDAKMLISKALEQVNLINEDVYDSTITINTTFSSHGRSLSMGNLHTSPTSPMVINDSVSSKFSPKLSSTREPKFFKTLHSKREAARSNPSRFQRNEPFIPSQFIYESSLPLMSSSNDSIERVVNVKKRPKRRVKKANTT